MDAIQINSLSQKGQAKDSKKARYKKSDASKHLDTLAFETKYCLWINQDTGNIHIVPSSTPLESMPFGYYVPHFTGTRKEMKKRKRIIMRKSMSNVTEF